MVVYHVVPPLASVKAQLIVNVILLFLAILVVVLRLVARKVSGASWGWDDLFIVISVPMGIGMVVISGMYSQLGVGYEITDVMENINIILQLLVAYELVYSVCIFTVKMSVLFFYLRVFVNRGLRLATKGCMYFVIAWTLGNILQCFLICRPFASTYDPTVTGTCGNRIASFIAIGAFNVVTDVLILTLPLHTVWKLKMRTSTKVGLTLVFTIGLSVSVVAIIRIIALTELDLNNLTYTMIYADFWSAFEINLAIFCVSLPMLGPLYAKYISKRTPSSLERSSNYAKASKRFNRLEEGHDQYPLDTIYAPNKEIHYKVAVNGHRSQSSGSGSGANSPPSLSGSETALTPDDRPLPPLVPLSGNITVEKHWNVSISRQ